MKVGIDYPIMKVRWFLNFFLLVYLFSQTGFTEEKANCEHYCNSNPQIHSAYATPQDRNTKILHISGDFFPDCSDGVNVTFSGIPLEVISSNNQEIQALVNSLDYSPGSHKILVEKTKCANSTDTLNLTISSPLSAPHQLTIRKTAPFAIFPNSYVKVFVSCHENERPVSGGWTFSNRELKVVSSYSDGRNWCIKISNNSKVTSELNEFYAICEH
jgi:hypothetical protein